MPASKRHSRCQHTAADGRRCAQSRARHSPLCLSHLRQQDTYYGASRVAAQLLGSRTRLDSALAINRVLGRLFVLVARNRIPARHAATLAYIAQLLLQSLPQMRTEQWLKRGPTEWQEALLQPLLTRAAAAEASPDLDQPLRQNDGGPESARSSRPVQTSVVYVPARNGWERP